MPNDVSDWVAITSVVVMLLFGGGGVAAWLKQRADVRNGVRQEKRADTDSLNARAIAIVETQFNFLVKPLQDKVADLETNIGALKDEVEAQKTKYWKAVTHIRLLYSWIARHVPSDVHQADVPAPPAELAPDI